MSTPAPFARISLHSGEGSRAECFTYAASSPILDICVGSTSAAISIAGRECDDTAVRFARELAQQAALFATEVERLHTEHATPETASTAADQAA